MLPIRLSHDLGAAKAFTCMSTLEEDVSFHWTSTCCVTQMDWDTIHRDTDYAAPCHSQDGLQGLLHRTLQEVITLEDLPLSQQTYVTCVIICLCVSYVCNKNVDIFPNHFRKRRLAMTSTLESLEALAI